MSVRIIETAEPLADPAVLAVREALRGGGMTAVGERDGLDVRGAVAEIVAAVRQRGDAALIELECKLDHAELTPATIRVSGEQIAAARAAADPAFLALVRRVIENIRTYQVRIMHHAPMPLERGGRELGVRYTPLDRVAVYVPGGRALYPSTVLMTVVPAQVAGVKQIALACPPREGGEVPAMVLALAGELGITEVYRLGGAVAVAALAFGTASVPAVDKIVGPGNAFVAEAKRQVMGRVGIDSIAGPSEVLIVADETPNPEHVAADMLAQAEHDPGSAVLVTTSRGLADAVAAAIERQLPTLERAEALRKALAQYSAIIVVPSLAVAVDVANSFATEHLQIVTADDEAVLAKIRHAGAIFLGPHTPVPLGDYYAGPSHVLPTGGTARFFGPLSCNDFLNASSLLRYDAAALADDAADTIAFAMREGLTAHANAVRVRTAGESGRR
jgi:histidinol dehydrogenase